MHLIILEKYKKKKMEKLEGEKILLEQNKF